MQDDIKERNREIEEGVFKATDDPKRPLVSPAVEAVPPHLNFAQWKNAVDVLNRSAADYRKALNKRTPTAVLRWHPLPLPKSTKCSSKASAS